MVMLTHKLSNEGKAHSIIRSHDKRCASFVIVYIDIVLQFLIKPLDDRVCCLSLSEKRKRTYSAKCIV